MTWRHFGGVCSVVLGWSCLGCSFLFADAAPSRHEELLYFDCTSTPGLEVADGVFGLSGTLAGIGVLSESEAKFERENDGGNRNTTAAIDFAAAGVFVASSIYGIVVTENCNDAKAKLRQRLIDRAKRRPVSQPAPLAPVAPPPQPAAPRASPPPSSPPLAPETAPATPPVTETPAAAPPGSASF